MPALSITAGDRIAILGDSILDYPTRATYDHLLGAWLHLYRPADDFSVWTLAKSGRSLGNFIDTYDGTTERWYSKWAAALEPSYVVVPFHDNGGYSQAVELQAINDLIDDHIVGVSGATPILLGAVPYTSTTGNSTYGGYDENHQIVAEAATPDWPYHRTWDELSPFFSEHQAMTASASTDRITGTAHGFADSDRVVVKTSSAPGGLANNTYYWVRDSDENTFKLAATEGGAAIDISSDGGTINVSRNWASLANDAADQVHPSNAGSILAAIAIWKGLGWGTDVSQATINGSAATLTSESDCTITGITPNAYGGVDFDRLDDRLPWAITEDWLDTGRADVNQVDPSTIGWQDYSLTVTGLASGTYDVICNGDTLATVTHTQLATGWNMADLTSGPVWEKGQAVLAAQREMLGINSSTLNIIGDPGSKLGVDRYKYWSDYHYRNNGLRVPALTATMADVIAEVETLNDAVIAAAQPETLSFSIRQVGYVAPPTGNKRSQAHVARILAAAL